VFNDITDTLKNVMKKLDPERSEDCFILCLKIISHMIRVQIKEHKELIAQLDDRSAAQESAFTSLTHSSISLYEECL
jgi:hypothetical protein